MTTTLSTHQGLLTKACNRLSSVLREEAGVIDIANQLPVNSEETREYLKNQRQQLRKARLALETGIAGVEKALEKYSMAADGLDPDTPSSSDIIEKVEANSETAQKLLDSAIGKLSQLIGVQDELEVDNQPFTTEGAPQVALPPIPIPKFSGKIWEWETFWGAFNHSVHSRSMDDLYKMNYLVDALQGEAKECIKHYEATSDRLGDQELLCERLNSLVSQLELKGEHVNNVFLQKQLLGKFSTEVQRHVLRQQHLSGAKWETKSLLAFAREYIRTEMQIIQHTGKPIREEPSVGTSNKETRRQTPKIAKPTFTCFYCNKTGHSPRECDEVPTREQRMEVIRKKNLCRNCGANDHHMSQCKRGACRICNEVGHHTSTCRGAVFSKEKQQMRVPQTQAKPPRTSKGVAQHSPSKTTKAAATRAHSVTAEELSTEQLTSDTVLHLTNDHRESHSLILIGQALVFNPLSQKLEKIHVVLDSGADRSFISSALADRLQLPETEQSVLKINTFGSSSPMTKRCSTTTVKLWDRDGLPHSYTVTKIDILTEPVQSSLLTQEDKRFLCDNNISLSISPNAENIQPDVLLGCADLFTLLEKDIGKQQILPSGLKILPSRLGHLVIGRTNAETGRDQSSVNVSRSTNAEHQDAMGCEGSNCSHRGPQQTNHGMEEERSDTEDLDRTPIDDSDSTTPTKGKSSQTRISLLNPADQKEGEACDNPQAEMWEQFFAFETYGVREFTGPAAKERDDINALVKKEFNETIKRKEDGYYSIDSCTAALAYALRFVKALSSRATPELRSRIEEHIPEASHMVNEAYITAAERKLALQVLLRNHQRVHFPTSRKNVLKQLKLQTDKQGILRCRGRLEKSGLPFDARQPVLIAAKSDLARLIVRQAHMPFHCGVSHTIANVRQNYWIPKLRQLTKSLIRTCVPCQKMNNIPYAYPDMQDLPECRVRKSRPFNHVGIDFFGPITAKENEVLKKVYGLIITCTTTRLLHLELTEEMSTTAVLLALRRFFARRGVPSTIISDNAPSFVLGNEVLRDTITSTPSSESLEKTMATKGITWKTITPYAPWQGAFYERLIKSVKQSLFKVIRGCTLEKEVLETLLIEIEGCLNSRPLTYQEEKWDETPILRPIDFLQRDIIVTYPFDFIQEEGDDEEYLPSEEALLLRTRRQAEEALRNSHQYTEQFWKIWSRDYISGLREKHILCLKGKNGTKTIPKVGTVVLVVDELLPRNSWKVGRITGLRTAQDGVIREAEVKTPNGRLIRRPVNLLVPLELNDTDDPLEASDQESSSDESCPIPKGEKKAEEGAQDNSRHQRYNLRPRVTNQGVRSASQKSTAGHIYLALMAMTLVMVLGVNGESGPNPKGTRFENQTTKMHCIPGGVRLTSTKATRYEICAEHHCQVKENPPNEEENAKHPPFATTYIAGSVQPIYSTQNALHDQRSQPRQQSYTS
ncbi:hypothetical protein GCK32_009436 [Trichostrongylus colubriformis]|uniref:Integrase catalytic domain-containing protein n=1 Tax=Trichostrongylus colubriformis TaxID=6319 RepID=A0AAN8FFA7_TRICO